MRTFILLNAVFLPLVFATTPKRGEDSPVKSELPKLKYFEDTLEDTHGKIIFSSILFRHGDRNPATTFLTDQYGEHFKKAGFGKLIKVPDFRIKFKTSSGECVVSHIGWKATCLSTRCMRARARYANLIPEGQISKTLKVYSSDTDRNLETAQMFLAAFCPPQSDAERWSSTLPWQPIPIHAISLSMDNFIAFKARCPRMSWEMNAAKELPFLKTLYENFTEPILTHLENSTQSKIPRTDPILGLFTIGGIFETLHSQYKMGLELPTWADLVYPEPLISVWEKFIQIFMSSDVSRRLKGGNVIDDGKSIAMRTCPLIERIINSMVNKRKAAAKNESTTNIFDVYSGHDTTIIILLNCLGMYNGDLPQYSAAVFVELRYKGNDHFVTVLYRNSEENAPVLLKLPNCGDPCRLDEFVNITKPLIPNDWNKECNTFFPDYSAMV